MQIMKERDDSHPLTGIIQLDDAYWGGEGRGEKRGRANMSLPIASLFPMACDAFRVLPRPDMYISRSSLVVVLRV